MTTTSVSTHRRPLGPLGRLGRWSARHSGVVFLSWAALIIALGVLAPQAETALSGGGWQADGSESVRARALIDRHFGGEGSYALAVVVSSPNHTTRDRAFKRAIERSEGVLRSEAAVARVQRPRPGESISRDGHVAAIRGGARADTAELCGRPAACQSG
jgi:RND superfamily putative drug exporter